MKGSPPLQNCFLLFIMTTLELGKGEVESIEAFYIEDYDVECVNEGERCEDIDEVFVSSLENNTSLQDKVEALTLNRVFTDFDDNEVPIIIRSSSLRWATIVVEDDGYFSEEYGESSSWKDWIYFQGHLFMSEDEFFTYMST